MPDPRPSASLHYLGHATLMMEMDGCNILTDPVLGDRVLHLRRRGLSGRHWYDRQTEPNLILLSHLHLDHLHLPTLRKLPSHLTLIAPRGAGAWLRYVIPQNIVELGPGEDYTLGDVTITATPALHGSKAGVLFAVLDLAQGYIIHGARTIYFPGDTDLFPEMTAIGDVGLDLALMPVWGWGPTLGAGHLDPYRAAQALALLRPRQAIPIHWATFRPMGKVWEQSSFLHNPGPEFQRLAAEHAPATSVHLIAPGDSFDLL